MKFIKNISIFLSFALSSAAMERDKQEEPSTCSKSYNIDNLNLRPSLVVRPPVDRVPPCRDRNEQTNRWEEIYPETLLRSQFDMACLHGNLELLWEEVHPETLLRSKFDVACVHGNLELLQEILQNVNEQYTFISQSSGVMKVTGLHMAAEFGHDAIVKALLKIAEEANKIKDFLSKTDSMDRTALELAREQKRTSVIEILDACN